MCRRVGDTSDMVQVASEEDTQIIDRLDALMEQGRLYLDPDLTLTRLARRLGLPVKTLSIVINRVSGEYVSCYINAPGSKLLAQHWSKGTV